MAMPSAQDIRTYISITGASESLAVQKLQEHGGNLFRAVDSFYKEEESLLFSGANPRRNEYREESQGNLHHSGSNSERQSSIPGLSPILAAARSFKPSLLLDPNYRRGFINRLASAGSSLLSPQPLASSVPLPLNNGPVIPDFDHRYTVEREHDPIGYNASDMENHTVEDELLQSVLKKSMLDIEAMPNAGHSERQFNQEEDDLARALAMSMETAEKEEALREQQVRVNKPALVIGRRPEPGSSSSKIESQMEEEEEQHLGGNSSHVATDHLHPHEEDTSHLREWGVSSAEELNEALIVEHALMGLKSAETSNNSASSSPRECDPSLDQETRVSKEPQDKEYQASLLRDKQKQEYSHREMLNDDADKSLASEKAQISSKPATDDENAVSLNFRLPNGSRSGCRFLKSDKLQTLFDFVDNGGEVKPGTYRVVRPYPRRVFNLDESSLTLSELGLTNKQEVLILELI